MFGEQQTRTLLGPVDPARNTAVAPPRLSARDLIDRAEATAEPVVRRRHARPTRRLVLTAGTLAVAAGASAIVHTIASPRPRRGRPGGGLHGDRGAEPGVVLVPVAYQFNSNASAAGPQLRALASKLIDAEYDNRTGHYMYHHTKVWGESGMTSPGGRYQFSDVLERKVWQAADGTGKQLVTALERQFPDQESRDYWQGKYEIHVAGSGPPAPGPIPPFLSDLAPLPSGRAQLSELLKVRFGAVAVSREVSTVYRRYVVPRQTRAEILRVLADVPGFLWRGEVTDRAGRKGVAITFDDHEHDGPKPVGPRQFLLIFDPNTGELLADEELSLSPARPSLYHMILDTEWTNRIG